MHFKNRSYTINHSFLLRILSERIKDGRVISLISRIMKSKIKDNDKYTKCEVGTPQGGGLSPILSNILLDKLDKELERRNLQFARYADDVIILCSSQRSAERILKSITDFIENKMHLKVNREKSGAHLISGRKVKFLGYGFTRTNIVEDKRTRKTTAKIKLKVHPRSSKKLKERAKKLLNKKAPKGILRTIKEYNQVMKGWFEYFKDGLTESGINKMNEWLRHKIRALYWKQWKRPRGRYRNLISCGTTHEKAYMLANSSKGIWATSCMEDLNYILTNKWVTAQGWYMMSLKN